MAVFSLNLKNRFCISEKYYLKVHIHPRENRRDSLLHALSSKMGFDMDLDLTMGPAECLLDMNRNDEIRRVECSQEELTLGIESTIELTLTNSQPIRARKISAENMEMGHWGLSHAGNLTR